MNCGSLIDVCGTKEAWSYVVEVVEIIETRAKVSYVKSFVFCILAIISCSSCQGRSDGGYIGIYTL